MIHWSVDTIEREVKWLCVDFQIAHTGTTACAKVAFYYILLQKVKNKLNTCSAMMTADIKSALA